MKTVKPELVGEGGLRYRWRNVAPVELAPEWSFGGVNYRYTRSTKVKYPGSTKEYIRRYYNVPAGTPLYNAGFKEIIVKNSGRLFRVAKGGRLVEVNWKTGRDK